MKVAKSFFIFGLSLLMGTCVSWEGDLDIDIGDYENQLIAWNSQNMLDYQLYVRDTTGHIPEEAHVTVKDGVPESSDPSYWLEYHQKSTIPEFYSYIKKLEKDKRDEYKGGNCSLKVSYNNKYYYPCEITWKVDNFISQLYLISLMPLEEGELEIDIGDYEGQLTAWNSQNMLDYRVKVLSDDNNRRGLSYIIVKNGITKNIYNPERVMDGKKATIPEFYSFIKEEEHRVRIRHQENIIDSYSFKVKYNYLYHYPNYIETSHLSTLMIGTVGNGNDKTWTISLIPMGPEEGDLEIDIGDYENQLAAWKNQNILNYNLIIRYYHGDYEGKGQDDYIELTIRNGVIVDVYSSEVNYSSRIEKTISEIFSYIKEEEERIRNEYNGICRCYLNVQYSSTAYSYPEQIRLSYGHRFGTYEHWKISFYNMSHETRENTK